MGEVAMTAAWVHPPVRKSGLFLVAGHLVVAACTLGCRERVSGEYAAFKEVMGTVVYARAVASSDDAARRAVEEAFAAVEDVGRVAVAEDEASELCKLNREGPSGPCVVSPTLLALIEDGVRLAGETGGYFQPAIGPVVDLYNIKKGQARWPTDAEVAAALPAVDLKYVIIDKRLRTVTYTRRDIRLDFGGIGEGWAADRAVAAMRAAGAKAGLVDVGGEVAVFGDRPGRRDGWRVGIKHPQRDGVFASFKLASGACATSGDYERRFRVGGREFSHIFNPFTGRPAAAGTSVTVVAASCAEADAWATALLAAPPGARERLLGKLPGAALFVDTTRGRISYRVYGPFPRLEVGT